MSTGLWFHIRAPISRRSSNWIVFDCAWIRAFFHYVLSELLPSFCFKSLVCHVLRLPKSCLSKHVCALVHFRNPHQNPLISFKTGSKSHDHTQILALVVVYLNEFNGLFFVVFVVVIIITFLLVLFQKLSFPLLNTCLPLLVSQLLLVVPENQRSKSSRYSLPRNLYQQFHHWVFWYNYPITHKNMSYFQLICANQKKTRNEC